jgi:hypothetical protein
MLLLVLLGSNFSRLLHTFFDACEEFTGSVSDHAEKFASSKPIFTNCNAVIPNAYHYHDVADVHLLKDCEKLVT